MSESIRAFLAIDLPAEVKAVLADLVEHLRQAHVRGLRPVRPEGVHLTLKFLGDVPTGQVEPIVNAVSRVGAECGPFRLGLDGVGAFPNRGAPRVLWVGMAGELEPLRALQSQIEDGVEALGFARERREFSPHLTLARLNESAGPADKRRAAELLNTTTLRPHSPFQVASVSLIRSILRPKGAVYEQIANMRLSGGTAHQT